MQRTVRAVTPAPASRLFAVVADLTSYPDWLDLVRRASIAEDDQGDPGPGPAYTVDLRANVGPLSRSKRLRMVRTAFDPERHARFERNELDAREHSAWTLDVEVEAVGAGSAVVMVLEYSGQLWMRPLEPVLSRHVDQGAERLRALVG